MNYFVTCELLEEDEISPPWCPSWVRTCFAGDNITMQKRFLTVRFLYPIRRTRLFRPPPFYDLRSPHISYRTLAFNVPQCALFTTGNRNRGQREARALSLIGEF